MGATDDLIRDAIEICAIAAPTGGEGERARFVADRFRELGVATEIDAMGNVVGEVPGDSRLPCVALAAHLDTVFLDDGPIPVERDGEFLCAPGIGDNSAGVAALLAVARSLGQDARGRILLVGTTGEEGNGDLRGMRHLIDTRGEEIDLLIAVEGAMRDRIVTAGVGSRRLRVKVHGPGGHSWGDAGVASAIEGAARFVQALYSLPLPEQPRTSVNVGTIEGGQSINSIAAVATLDLDLRSLDEVVVSDLEQRVLDLTSHCFPANGPLHSVVEKIGHRPAGAIRKDHRLLDHVRAARKECGLREAEEIFSSTDANVPLARGIPACCVGVGLGQDVHRRSERLSTVGLDLGLAALLNIVRKVAGDRSLVGARRGV